MTSPRVASWLGRLEARFLRRYRATIALCLLGLLVQSMLLLPIPLIQGRVLDGLLGWARERAVSERVIARTIVFAFLVMAACHLVRMGLAWKVATTMGRISQEVVVALRTALHQKLMRLPMTYFDVNQTGRLMARVTSDVASILTFLNVGSLQLVNDLILALGISVLLFWLQWPLALVTLVVMPLYVINQRVSSKKIQSLSVAIRAQIASIYGLLSERVSAVRVVRSFAKENDELAALDAQIDTHRSLSWSNTRTSAALSALATLISGTGTVFVITYGAILVSRGRMTAGELVAFYALIGQLYNPIVRLTQFQATAVAMQVSVERLFEVLDEPELICDRLDARPVVKPRGRLTFRNVRFAYGAGHPARLVGVDLVVEPGTTLGVFGASGSGKSTLLALIPRLYDLPEDGGAILLDGEDIRDLKVGDLRRAVALVPQQTTLFEGTIRTNLLYAGPDADERRIRQALEASDFAATVDGLPLGLETPVNERGYSLSGGQRQRLALARALVADPAVLLLDDCTSALDAETESRVRRALASLSPRKTCVIVSHKLASLSAADQIVVLEHGVIIERGTHEELIAYGGRYAEAYEQQTRLGGVLAAC